MVKPKPIHDISTLIACGLGFFLICLYTSYSGIGISPDSIMYTSAARSFSAEGTLKTFNGIPIVDFPMFYPLFLGIIKVITRVDPTAFGVILNGTLFASLLYTAGWIMNRFAPSSQLYKWLLLVAIALSPGLLQIYSYLWSETLFILEVLFFIVAFRQYLNTHAGKWLVLAAIIAAIGCVTRYAAVTIVGTGGLLLLLDRSLPIKKKIGHIFIYGIICISLLVANLTFNTFATGTVTGPREPSITPFIKNLYYFGTIMCDWMGFTPEQYFLAIPIASVILLGFIVALAINYFRRSLNSYENLAITFSLVYGLFIILSSTFSRYERINSRLLSPLYITALWGYTSWVLLWIKSVDTKRTRQIIGTIATIIMLGFIGKEGYIDYKRYMDQVADDYGAPGYTDSSWQENEFANFLRSDEGKKFMDPKVLIYTDAHEAVYFFSGMSAYLLPHRYFKNDVALFYRRDHYYLVWFNNLENPELINIKDIQKVRNLKLLKQFPEGAIYEYDKSKDETRTD
ncbi:hypothetical protein [Mucilaginibacter pedocola]|uniref:Glycosyltransferase RgtA/B/C/D-like domain-containing protein n=1 Tax=Mucilaginibacter pedocola TaxID=1792845 RepID=A0A1S9PJF1_9SPHI|nr:hypothetical protein [Mucilaginibacter pedocola]OOQ61082.1 hypothetical protein BC343_21795 [Mucilaginibacter pedocola]